MAGVAKRILLIGLLVALVVVGVCVIVDSFQDNLDHRANLLVSFVVLLVTKTIMPWTFFIMGFFVCGIALVALLEWVNVWP